MHRVQAWHLHYIIRHRVTIDHYQFLPYRLLLSFSLRIRINSISDSYKNVYREISRVWQMFKNNVI